MSMCGICGKIYFDAARPVEPEILKEMARLLNHRGPDEDGYHIKGNVGLGHRRLSIIDLVSGRQPVYNEDRTLVILFNGEIYNHRLLREELVNKGHHFSTRSDTEVIVHLYEELGPRCLERLRGMFAIAIWDDKAQQLFLARDRVGKKPLYYAHLNDAFLFASELKGLLAEPKISRDIDYKALHDYLTFQYVPPPATIFKDIKKLEPAHYLLLKNGSVETHRYWDLVYEPKTQITEAQALEQTFAMIEDAVKVRLESEVPLGVFLSGGVDSSAVVAFMRRHVTGELKTFSIGFEEEQFNELPYARQVAELFETKHEEFVVRPNTIEILPKLVWHFDEPYADFSALPTYYVAQITKKYVTVALNGDGGDESFLGYMRYRGFSAFNRYGKIPRPIRSLLIRPPVNLLCKIFPNSTFFEKAYYLNTASLYGPARLYAQTMVIFRDYMKEKMYAPELAYLAREYDSLDYTISRFNEPQAKNLVEKKVRSDIMTYLHGDLLPKVDRTTMAHGLEGRSPFLDQYVMEYAARLPLEIKFKNGILKYHLKQVLKDLLPHNILWRKKQGFGVPIGEWFKDELFDFTRDILFSEQARSRGFFNMPYVEKMLYDHRHNRQNHHHRLWALLSLEVWCRTFLDRKDISAGPLSF